MTVDSLATVQKRETRTQKKELIEGRTVKGKRRYERIDARKKERR